jgi:hypothetical protein
MITGDTPMKTYSFPIAFDKFLQVPAEVPRVLKVVAENYLEARNMMDSAIKRQYPVRNPNQYAYGVVKLTPEQEIAYLAKRGVIVEDGDTTGVSDRKLMTVSDSGYLSDLEGDPLLAIKSIRESKKAILKEFPTATNFNIAAYSDTDTTFSSFEMRFQRLETQAEADLREVVDFYKAALKRTEKLAQLADLKKELGEG